MHVKEIPLFRLNEIWELSSHQLAMAVSSAMHTLHSTQMHLYTTSRHGPKLHVHLNIFIVLAAHWSLKIGS